MFNKTLIILDTNKNVKIDITKFDLINLGNSYVENKINYKEILMDNSIKKLFPFYRKKFSNKIYFKIKKMFKGLPIDPNFLELINLRNDKNPIFEKIILLAIIKKKINLKKYKKIHIYFDDLRVKSLYSDLFKGKKISFVFQNHINKSEAKIRLIHLLKFLSKVLITSWICKIFTPKEILKKRNELYISIFPLLFFNQKKNSNNLNFIHTDDTHFSENYLNTLKRIITSIKNNMINIEYFIKIGDLFNQIKFFIMFKVKLVNSFKKKIVFEDINISKILHDYFEISLLNYFKLSSTQNAIIRANKILAPKNIYYFLFEYNFGFYIKKNFLDLNKKIKFYGFQHGIFNENLMWLDIIKHNENFKEYLPQNIYYKYFKSKKSYSKIFKKVKLFKRNINKNKINFKIKKNSNLSLVILGLHDYKETIYKINNFIALNPTNQKFICKLHPKTNFVNIYKKIDNNIKIVRKLDINKFRKIFVSKYSTLTYDFNLNKVPFFVIHKNIFDYNYPNFIKKNMLKLK